MEDHNQVYLQFPLLQPEEPLFLKNSDEEQEYPHLSKRNEQIMEEVITGKPIDEHLLKKTSELHESLRNKKLLDFQLLEAQIMNKNNYANAQQLLNDILTIKETKKKLTIQSKNSKKSIEKLQKQIEKQKRTNTSQIKKIEEINKIIVKNEQVLSMKQKQSSLSLIYEKDLKLKEHGYVSIEKIRLQAENQSKGQFVEEIKSLVGKLKDNISRKQIQKEKLETEYQQLLKEIAKEEKNRKSQRKLIEPTKRQNEIYRLYSEQSQEIIEKENNMNQTNIIGNENKIIKESRLKQKNNSETTVSKHKEGVIKQQHQVKTGKKALSKKML